MQTHSLAVNLPAVRHRSTSRERRQSGFPAPPTRLISATVLLAATGIAVAALIAYIHLRHQRDSAYTSFCNVGGVFDCDRVLTSSFSAVAGVPVAYLALIAYAGIAAMAVAARRTARPILAHGLVAGASACLVFSLYMAGISLFVLRAVCLLCSALYLVAIATFAAVVAAALRWPRAPGRPPAVSPAALWGWIAAATVGVAALAAFTWPRGWLPAARHMSLEALRAMDPDFFDWYTSLPVVTPPAGGHLALGSPAAPVTIIEFSDFECAYCRQNHDLLKDLAARRPGQVGVYYRHFPLDASCNDAVRRTIHPRACRAAEAAECAAAQGRFAAMADALFEHQGELHEATFLRLAEQIGLDVAKFRRCMDEHQGLAKVVADARAGSELHVTSTPTLLINGRKVVGSLSRPGAYDVAVMIEAQSLRKAPR